MESGRGEALTLARRSGDGHQEVVDHVWRVAPPRSRSPDRIVLFGSAARGETGPDSDVDLLVVKAGVSHRRRLAQQIYRALLGLELPVDVLVVTPEDIEAFRDRIGTIIGPALREGREVYVA